MLKKICIYLVIILQSNMVFSFDLTDEGIDKAIRNYLSFQMDTIDESVVDEFTQLVENNLDVFGYIAEAQTDPTVLPYLEKYNALKMKYTGQPINANIKVILSNHLMKNTQHDRSMIFAGYCDSLTRTVFLDRGFWNFHKDNEKMREALLYHELGHCDLNRKHSDGGGYEQRQPYFSFMNLHLLEPLLIPYIFEQEQEREERCSREIDAWRGGGPPLTFVCNGYSDKCSREVVEEYMRRGGYPGCNIDLESYHYEYVLNNDLDRAFEALNEELFSIQNTTTGVEYINDGGRIKSTYTYRQFEPLYLPIIKHITIGPAIAPTAQDFYEGF